jgi:hypothetical protein
MNNEPHVTRRGWLKNGNPPGNLRTGGVAEYHANKNVLFGKDQRYVLFRMDDVIFFEVENTSTGRGSNMSVAPGVIRPLLSCGHSFEEKSSLVKD